MKVKKIMEFWNANPKYSGFLGFCIWLVILAETLAMNRLLKKKEFTQGLHYFLLGARGTGKSSWLRKTFPSAIYIDLLDNKIFMELYLKRKVIADLIPTDYKGWVIIDEVQRVPQLLNEIHKLIEAKKNSFILTASSVRSLRNKGTNLLGGRAITVHMFPFVSEELKRKFDIEKALKFGLVPLVYNSKNPEKQIQAYVQTFIKEEVFKETILRNLQAFNYFLELASLSQGQPVSKLKISSEIGVAQKTVQNYFCILEDLLLASFIPVFRKRAKRKTFKKNPKFYFFDVGVFQALRPRGFLDSVAEIDGPALETLFLQHVKAINSYLKLKYDFFYWRTLAGVEVDFILYGPKGFFAFEIKRARKVSRYDLKGLKSFQKDYPEAKLILAYGGKQRYYMDDVDIIPIEDVLKNMTKILLSFEKKND